MYILHFKKVNSKNFYEALCFARELGGSFDGKIVTIKVPDSELLEAYMTFRTLFGLIQSWHGTRATYNGKEVDPYKFILKMHRVRECARESEDCGENWDCKRLTLNHREHRVGLSWFNIGKFSGNKFVIDKPEIKSILKRDAYALGVDLCPFYDETKVLSFVDALPSYIIPDGVYYGVVYKEIGAVLVKDNIKLLRKEPEFKRTLIQ